MVNWPKQRAWGWYATLVRTPWFCIKILRFKPYGKLSMQRHEHRSEVWLFLKGFGLIEYHPYVYIEPPINVRRIWSNKWCDFWKIKKGFWHRFAAFHTPVYIIELQYGNKVTEDDIERK